MSDWRLSFYRGEASLEAAGLAFGPARVVQAVLRLVDVDGAVELAGGIEPFAHHRTALERLELQLDPSDHLQAGESVQWQGDHLRVVTPTVCGELVVDRLNDRGLRLVPVKAWSCARGRGGATKQLLDWLDARFGGHRCDDPVEIFAKRGLVKAGRRRTRLRQGRVGWTHEGEHPVYVFDRSETPGEALPMRSFAADFEDLLGRVGRGELEAAARQTRQRILDSELSDDAVALAVDLLAERDDALDLLEQLLPRVDRLSRSLALARRKPTTAAWLDAADACKSASLPQLERQALLAQLEAGVAKPRIAEVIERILALGSLSDAMLKRLARVAERHDHRRLAISILRRLVGRHEVEEAIDAVVRLGELHLAEGNRPRARHYFALALTAGQHPAALEGAAWIALEDNDSDYAIACLERAARHDEVPASRRATHWRTVARLRYEGSAAAPAAAITCLQEASIVDPGGRADDLRQAALWWRAAGRPERALQCVEARLELPGEATRWEYEAAQLLLELGRPGEAAGAAARALVSKELACQVYPLLVSALRQAARDEALPDVIRRWFAVDPDAVSDSLLAMAVQAYNDRGAMAEALLQRQPAKEPALFRAVAETRFAEGDGQAAKKLVFQALEYHPDLSGLWALALRIALAEEDAPAVLEAQKALYKNDPSEERMLALAEAHLAVQGYAEAVSLFEKVEAGRLRAARLHLEHFGDAARCLELVGAPDRLNPDQLLLGERAALLVGDGAHVERWSRAIFDLGFDRDGDSDRVARLIAGDGLTDDESERMALVLVERGGLTEPALRSLLAGAQQRQLSVACARLLDALREISDDSALTRARLDLALTAGDLPVAQQLMRNLFPEGADHLEPGDRRRLDSYLEQLDRAGDLAELERALTQFSALTDDASMAWRLAKLLAQMGRYQEACDTYQRAFTQEPTVAAAAPTDWIDAARSLGDMGALRLALDAVQRWLPVELESAAVIDVAEGVEGEEALAYWRRAHELEPERDEVLRRLVTLAADLVEPEDALTLLMRWINRPGDTVPEGLAATCRRIASRFVDAGQPDQARYLFGVASRRFPQDLDLAAAWISSVDGGGDHDRMAAARVEVAERNDDRRADVWLSEAVDLHLGLPGHHGRAVELLEQLVLRRADDPVPALRLEQFAAQASDWPLRLRVGRIILQRNQDHERRNDRLRVMADIAAERLGDIDQALALMQEIEPRTMTEAAENTERMIQMAMAGGHAPLVVDLLDTLVDEAADDYGAVEALVRRARARGEGGDLDAAFEDLDRAKARGGEPLRIAALRTELAELHGRDDLLLSALRAWIDELPVGEARAALLYRYAMKRVSMGRGDEAIPPLTEALEMGNEALRSRAFEALYPLLAPRGSGPVLAELLATHAVELEDRLAAAALMADVPGGLSKAIRLARGVADTDGEPGVAAAGGWLLAALHERADQPAQAADQYALVRLRGDRGEEVIYHEVRCRLRGGQPANAIRLIDDHQLKDPELRVEALSRLGRYGEAASILEGLKTGEAVCRRAKLLASELHRAPDAIDELRDWLDETPDDQDALVLLEEIATEAGDAVNTSWARRALGKLVEGNPLARAQWLHRAAQVASSHDEALRLLQEAVELDRDSVAILRAFGEALESAGRHQLAAGVAMDLAERVEGTGERVVHLLRAAASLMHVNPGGASDVLDRIDTLVEGDVRVLRMRVEIASSAADIEAEVNMLRRLAKGTADKEERLRSLRRAAELSGDTDLLRMVVMHDPDDVDARLFLAQVALREGKTEAAVAEFRSLASRLEGDAAAAALHRAAGLLWRRRGDVQAALDLLGEALESVAHAATFPEPFMLLSEIYESQGDRAASAAVLAPLFDVLGALDETLAARVIMQAVSGGLSDLAFEHLVALEAERPDSLPLQQAVLHYLRHQRDWQALAGRLAWIGETFDDAGADLELCARAEQGMVPLDSPMVAAAQARLQRRDGLAATLAASPIKRAEISGMPLGLPAVAVPSPAPSLRPVEQPVDDQPFIQDQMPTVPAQKALEAGVLPPAEGEDPPLEFSWDDHPESDVFVVSGDAQELLAQARDAELSGQLKKARQFIEAALVAAPDDPGVIDAGASFLARHPNL